MDFIEKKKKTFYSSSQIPLMCFNVINLPFIANQCLICWSKFANTVYVRLSVSMLAAFYSLKLFHIFFFP